MCAIGTHSLKAEILVNKVINKISKLGLEMARDVETEAILFYGRRLDADLPRCIMVGDTPIDFSSNIKYLGILINVNWKFNFHYNYIEEKAGRVVRALNRLMPNLRGPDERRKRLYANVVMSMIMYGAPMWGDTIGTSKLLPALYKLQRSVAQRVVSAYRSVSSDAALLLARFPPIKHLARMRRRVYILIKEHKEAGTLSTETYEEIKDIEFQRMCDEWRD
ncbi:reverse transcriptase [Lasius niger]|uniref:Reverse transcriptase n=1 Tax=Lasius niger TaxID=67767 RepID=A0A0J7K710_LASNI|nr:reverse transcriptase [Lasius niger]